MSNLNCYIRKMIYAQHRITIPIISIELVVVFLLMTGFLKTIRCNNKTEKKKINKQHAKLPCVLLNSLTVTLAWKSFHLYNAKPTNFSVNKQFVCRSNINSYTNNGTRCIVGKETFRISFCKCKKCINEIPLSRLGRIILGQNYGIDKNVFGRWDMHRWINCVVNSVISILILPLN